MVPYLGRRIVPVSVNALRQLLAFDVTMSMKRVGVNDEWTAALRGLQPGPIAVVVTATSDMNAALSFVDTVPTPAQLDGVPR